MVQDIRIGQWKQVRTCSAFAVPDQIRCNEECRGLMNLGLLMPHGGTGRLAG
jgi:hypothetical protein